MGRKKRPASRPINFAVLNSFSHGSVTPDYGGLSSSCNLQQTERGIVQCNTTVNYSEPKCKRSTPSLSPNSIEESYMVKKYRPDQSFKSIEAFQRYTKSHRMTDAAYVRVQPPGRGATPDKPLVFSTRVGGSNLSWGRGKTRDAAIDCACRAAFALVAAHGYNDYELDEDCLLTEPTSVLMGTLPPPPPPPPPPTTISTQSNFPPPPCGGTFTPALGSSLNGLVPPPPPDAPPLPGDLHLIPQPKIMGSKLTVASSLSQPHSSLLTSTSCSDVTGLPSACSAPQSLSLSLSESIMNTKIMPSKCKLKGGLTLVYDDTIEMKEGMEFSMEERRADIPRYRSLVYKAVINRVNAGVPSH